jgi:hypothetical protein
MRYILAAFLMLIVLLVGVVLYAWSGLYNIAATKPHWAITSTFIEILRDRSIAVHSDAIKIMNISEGELRKNSFTGYHEMCRLCHGAPEYQPEEFAKGLYPEPLSMMAGHIQEELSDREIYWIVKNGIKLTGMPAFGPTHNEAELRGLVAIAKEITQMSPEFYRRQVEQETSREEGHGH